MEVTAAANSHGRVLDSASLAPIRAFITDEHSIAIFSVLPSGAFTIPVGKSEHRAVKFHAIGYTDEQVQFVGGSDQAPQLILMTPSEKATVQVVAADNVPIEGVSVTWSTALTSKQGSTYAAWIYGGVVPASHSQQVATDKQGCSSVAAGTNMLARIAQPNCTTFQQVLVRPGESKRITLLGTCLTLKFIDVTTAAPLRGFPVEAWCPREISGKVTELQTDTLGMVQIGGASLPLLVRAAGPAMWEYDVVCTAPNVSLVGLGGPIRRILQFDQLPDDTHPIEVRLSRACGIIKLTNASSGEPITANVRLEAYEPAGCPDEKARVESICTAHAPRAERDDIFGTTRVIEGVLRLPLTLAVKYGDGLVSGAMVSIFVDGYDVMRVAATDLPWASTAADLELALQPVEQRLLLVHDSAGALITLPIKILSPDMNAVVWESTGSATGVHGPFAWKSGDLLVRVGSGREWPYVLAESQVESAHQIELTLPCSTGSILVQDVPQHAQPWRLEAKYGSGSSGVTYYPTISNNGDCKFESLPDGHYMVGPHIWIQIAELNSISHNGDSLSLNPGLARVQVAEGQSTVIKWFGEWEANCELAGRIAVQSPEPIDTFVIPIFGMRIPQADTQAGPVSRIVLGRSRPFIPLDLDGNYRIGFHDALPQLLIVCAVDDGLWGNVDGMHVLETLFPGESIDVPTASVELSEQPAASREPVDVAYDIPAEALRYPIVTNHSGSVSKWHPNTVLNLRGVPIHVTQLRIDGRSLAISLKPNEVARYVVNIPALSSAIEPTNK